jgi:protein tyrosine/serine phosphatase
MLSRHLHRTVAWAVLPLIVIGIASRPSAGDDLTKIPIERLHRVDERLFRGSQPDAEGFRHLRDLGVRTVINFRLPSDAVETGEQQIVETLGMRYVNLPIQDGNFFTWFRQIPAETVKQFFSVLEAEQGPFFVHCRRGTDRTGAMVAFYRMARNGWDAPRAKNEADSVGMRFWYRGLRRQISAFNPAELLQAARP